MFTSCAMFHMLINENFICWQSERVRKVLDHVNEVHFLCGLLGMDFVNTVSEIHPSLHETGTGKSTNISNDTLDGLAQAIIKLKVEKKQRFLKVSSLYVIGDLLPYFVCAFFVLIYIYIFFNFS